MNTKEIREDAEESQDYRDLRILKLCAEVERLQKRVEKLEGYIDRLVLEDHIRLWEDIDQMMDTEENYKWQKGDDDIG